MGSCVSQPLAASHVLVTCSQRFDTSVLDVYSSNAKRFECSICVNVIQNAVNLNCAHLFCKICIEQVANRRCPICRTDMPIETPPLNHAINHEIANTRACCPFTVSGCDVVCAFGMNGANLAAHSETCAFKSSECSGCGTHISDGHMASHLTTQCVKRKVLCPICGMMIPFGVMDTHWTFSSPFICANKQPCARGCCEGLFDAYPTNNNNDNNKAQTATLKMHALICPLEPVTCACGMHMTRTELDAHKQHVCAIGLVSCPECGVSMMRREQQQHASIPPFGCANKRLCDRGHCRFDIRNSAKAHALNCPFESVSCELPGCGVRMDRQDLFGHMRLCMMRTERQHGLYDHFVRCAMQSSLAKDSSLRAMILIFEHKVIANETALGQDLNVISQKQICQNAQSSASSIAHFDNDVIIIVDASLPMASVQDEVTRVHVKHPQYWAYTSRLNGTRRTNRLLADVHTATISSWPNPVLYVRDLSRCAPHSTMADHILILVKWFDVPKQKLTLLASFTFHPTTTTLAHVKERVRAVLSSSSSSWLQECGIRVWEEQSIPHDSFPPCCNDDISLSEQGVSANGDILLMQPDHSDADNNRFKSEYDQRVAVEASKHHHSQFSFQNDVVSYLRFMETGGLVLF